MRLATLDVWPDAPHLEMTVTYRWLRGPMNAVARYCMGLHHDDDHLGQIADIVRQAHAARQPAEGKKLTTDFTDLTDSHGSTLESTRSYPYYP